MARTIGDLLFGFRGDGKQLVVDARKAGGDAGTAGAQSFDKTFSGRIKSLKAEFSRGGGIPGALMGGVGLGVGLGAFSAISNGIGMVTDFLGDAGKAASDLAETQTKLTAVFPVQADAIRDWAKDSATAMGISTQAALESTATLGNFLQAMGQTPDAAADMSKSIVQLTSDLASFNNQNPEEVLLALRSGLAGETEPLRKFGVDVSDAAVQAELLATGAVKIGKNFSAAQKVQARYALIMRQTVRAQGDFNRTADGTANKTRTAAAQTENLKAKLGELINNVQNVAAALAGTAALALTNALDAVGVAWNDLMRIMDAGMAFEQDVDKAIREQAASLGLNAAALIEFSDAQRQAAKEGQAIAEERSRQMEAAAIALNIIGDATAEQTAQMEEWIRVQIEAGEAVDTTTAATDGLTAAQRAAAAMVTAFIAAGMPVPELLTDIGDAAADGLVPIPDIVKGSLTPVPGIVEDVLSPLTGIVKGILVQTRNEVKDRMADIRWSLEHPTREKGLKKKYRDAIKDGTDAMNAALKSGNAAAYAKAVKFVADMKAKLAELRRADWSFRATVGFGESQDASDRWNAQNRRATGGPVRRDMPYLVGERGPEWHVPETNGQIVNQDQLAAMTGGGRMDIHVHDDRVVVTGPSGTRQVAIASPDQAIRRWEDG